MNKFATLWFWKGDRLSHNWFQVKSFNTNEHPHPSVVGGADVSFSATPFSWSGLDELGHLIVGVDHGHLPNAPSLWHVLVREYDRFTPAQSLVSFATDHFVDGTVVEMDEFKSLGVSMGDRLAAIRWGYGDPKIEQLYVHEDHRRKRIGTKIINVADLVNVAGGWGGFIYGGDQVTDMGAQVASAWTNSSRLLQKEVSLPPMN